MGYSPQFVPNDHSRNDYRNTRTRRETCSKSTIVNFEQVTAGWDEDGFNDMVLGFYF